MFAIVISDKGGAERRETFGRSEITVGRVQGNDVMLPKGNVSKKHARLLFRDGRFIVTDLNSTNGTYVNGKRAERAELTPGSVVRIGHTLGVLVRRTAADHPTEFGPIGSGLVGGPRLAAAVEPARRADETSL